MSNLTNAESYTWQIIQENYEKIPQLSISELAELAHVSLSTVNRTVRKKELLKTIENISAEEIEKAVELIQESEEILIFSRGLSTNVADELMKKLQLFRKPVSLHDDSKYMAYYARFVNEKSLIIVLSLSGETVEILNALNIAKGQNPKILSLTVNANTSLTNLSDISLIGYKSSLEVNYFDLDVHSRLSLSILSRVLIDAYSIYTLKQ